MNFYIDPAFYVFLALAVIPAAILGFTGHRIRYYGLAASLGFLLLLFGENAQGMAAFLGFLAVACAATFWVLVYCQALADKIGVMISTLSAFCVPTAFPTSEICQA